MADTPEQSGDRASQHPQEPPQPGRLICQVEAIEQVTHDIRIVRLRPIDGSHFHFLAGQYAQLGFDEHEPRDYSMANRPDEAAVEFHIRDSQDGGASSYVAESLTMGERVTLDGPYGDSYLRSDHAGDIVAVAGGSGLAPMKSIVEEALAQGWESAIDLYFGARTEADLYLLDHFAELERRYRNFRFTPVLSDPQERTQRRVGMVTDIMAEDLEDASDKKAYLAGPPIMVEAAVALLLKLGASETDIHADAFYTEAEKATMQASS
ncbi:MAG: FAD-binding oxidoreductase [Rhodovibrionaceae bacterium]|nr:FAD-binding oxidoreductase [Rhodovibrionaceae bacterium]